MREWATCNAVFEVVVATANHNQVYRRQEIFVFFSVFLSVFVLVGCLSLAWCVFEKCKYSSVFRLRILRVKTIFCVHHGRALIKWHILTTTAATVLAYFAFIYLFYLTGLSFSLFFCISFSSDHHYRLNRRMRLVSCWLCLLTAGRRLPRYGMVYVCPHVIYTRFVFTSSFSSFAFK